MRAFKSYFGVHSLTRVLDVGGTYYNWSLLPDLPRPVIVNLSLPDRQDRREDIIWIVADGRALLFADKTFDIVYSSSVIEHLETLENQIWFAKECRRVGKAYYIQTPNRLFPFEPHFLTPLFQYLPKKLQRKLLRYTVRYLLDQVPLYLFEKMWSEIRLLDAIELQRLFPDAELWRETFFGLAKSLIAVRRLL